MRPRSVEAEGGTRDCRRSLRFGAFRAWAARIRAHAGSPRGQTRTSGRGYRRGLPAVSRSQHQQRLARGLGGRAYRACRVVCAPNRGTAVVATLSRSLVPEGGRPPGGLWNYAPRPEGVNLSRAFLTSASSGFKRRYLSAKSISAAGLPWCCWRRCKSPVRISAISNRIGASKNPIVVPSRGALCKGFIIAHGIRD